MSRTAQGEVLLGLTGFARAGKSEIAGFVQREYGYATIKPSDVVRDALVKKNGERKFARFEYRAMSEELRQSSGPGYYLDGVDYHAERTLIDGTRHLDTAHFIQRAGGILIGVVARPDVRFERALAADDAKCKPASLEVFEAEERPEMNASHLERGGQILKVLCCAHPRDIIDTTDMAIDDMYSAVALLLARYNITPTIDDA